jgi:hypothetical protein
LEPELPEEPELLGEPEPHAATAVRAMITAPLEALKRFGIWQTGCRVVGSTAGTAVVIRL